MKDLNSTITKFNNDKKRTNNTTIIQNRQGVANFSYFEKMKVVL
jgi:hypothetical protein